MAQRIEIWLIDRLIPWIKNPRTHSDAQVAQIAASIEAFGFNNPILIDTKAGIIAGRGRLLAARKLGLTEVPVIVLDHLSEAQKRAYLIADNQLALNAGWDQDLLRLELTALQDEEFNLDLIGFDDEELARLSAAQDAVAGSRAAELGTCSQNRPIIKNLMAPTYRAPCAQAAAPQELTKRDVKRPTATAERREDHLKLAAYYTAEADRLTPRWPAGATASV